MQQDIGIIKCFALLIIFFCGMYYYANVFKLDLVPANEASLSSSSSSSSSLFSSSVIQEAMASLSSNEPSSSSSSSSSASSSAPSPPQSLKSKMEAKKVDASTSADRCPDVLIKKGPKIYLYNSKHANIPGVNPIVFNNLEEYTEFLSWQRSQGINCPVLFLEHSYDAQGNAVYRARPSVHNLQGGLGYSLLVDGARDNAPYNQSIAPSFDPANQDIGVETPQDGMNEREASLLYSTDAMMDNWGGAAFTQHFIDRGDFSGNEVFMAV